MKNFDSLGLSEALLRAIHEKGYTQASPIQAQAIPAVLAGKDVLAAAQTGTGKTAGFTLPLLQRMSTQNQKGGPRPIKALVITPTRELAAQVLESVKAYGKFLSLRSTVVFGGVPVQPQKNILAKGVDILVATPGRLLDLVGQRVVDLSKVNFLVLDEADRMLDMGFIHDIRKVLALLPSERQNLLFSATFSEGVRKLAKGFMHDPVSIDVAPRNTAAETVAQRIYKVDKKRKPALLKHLIQSDDWKQVLVFTRTKYGANRLAKKLDRSGIHSMAIHGNKSQGARTKALKAFKSGQVRVLVATDIAARGLDIEQLPWVVNFDLPNVAEDYVHRIGRTGRAGMKGQAVSLVCDEEQKQLKGIERLLGKRLESDVIDGFEPGQGEEHVEQRPSNQSVNRNHNRKSKSRPAKKQQRRKPAEQKAKTESGEQKQSGQDRDQKKKARQTDQKAKRDNNKKPANQKNKQNKQNKKSKRKSNNSKSNEESNSKSVPFSKAYKKRKPGTKGPIGYGMFPLE